jgi:hypothetical protein
LWTDKKKNEIQEENKMKEKNKYSVRGTVTGERDGRGVLNNEG